MQAVDCALWIANLFVLCVSIVGCKIGSDTKDVKMGYALQWFSTINIAWQGMFVLCALLHRYRFPQFRILLVAALATVIVWYSFNVCMLIAGFVEFGRFAEDGCDNHLELCNFGKFLIAYFVVLVLAFLGYVWHKLGVCAE